MRDIIECRGVRGVLWRAARMPLPTLTLRCPFALRFQIRLFARLCQLLIKLTISNNRDHRVDNGRYSSDGSAIAAENGVGGQD